MVDLKKLVIDEQVKVIDTPPQGADRDEHPVWVSDMDKYAGLTGEVIDFDEQGRCVKVEFDDGGFWWYAPEWLELPFERAKGVPPDPFEEKADEPVAPEGDPKRRRVSNGLFALAKDAVKLEDDFSYQYDYNQQLVHELADANKKVVSMVADYGLVCKQLEAEKALHAEDSRVAALAINDLDRKVRNCRRPSRLLKTFAAVGWILALLSGGVIAAEKITGEAIDKLADGAIIYLVEATNL